MTLEELERERLLDKRANVKADLENVKGQVDNFQRLLADIDDQLTRLPERNARW